MAQVSYQTVSSNSTLADGRGEWEVNTVIERKHLSFGDFLALRPNTINCPSQMEFVRSHQSSVYPCAKPHVRFDDQTQRSVCSTIGCLIPAGSEIRGSPGLSFFSFPHSSSLRSWRMRRTIQCHNTTFNRDKLWDFIFISTIRFTHTIMQYPHKRHQQRNISFSTHFTDEPARIPSESRLVLCYGPGSSLRSIS